MNKKFQKFWYNLRILMMGSRIDKHTLTDFGKEIAYENTIKIRYSVIALSIGSVFFVLKDLYGEFNRVIALDYMHSIEKVGNILLCCTLAFYFLIKCKNREEHFRHYNRNMFIVNLIVLFVLFTILISGYTEILHFAKESSFRIFIVCINFIVIVNFQQRAIANFMINMMYCVMLYYTGISFEQAIVHWFSFAGIQIIIVYLSDLQFKLWRSNYFSQSKLHYANRALAAINEKLIVSESNLKVANDELQNFVYTISHDLREPLRISNNFSSILLENKQNFSSSRELTMLEQIKKNLWRMNLMLEDLLEFSRVNNKKLVNTKVDLKEVIKIVEGNLQDRIQESNTKIIYENLPAIEGNQSELISLFQNLISNGIKYRSALDPIIKIDYENDGAFFNLVFEDNGIGINSDEQAKVFNIFYRASNVKEIEGTGIGLSICQRIVEKMRGTIRIESSLGMGAKFIIHLPKTNF